MTVSPRGWREYVLMAVTGSSPSRHGGGDGGVFAYTLLRLAHPIPAATRLLWEGRLTRLPADADPHPPRIPSTVADPSRACAG